MISVIDYGAGNLRSVENALIHLEVPYAITSRAEDVARAKAILLPGVGHFGQMMRSLERLELVPVLRDAIARGVSYLGICLGMHALFESSEEAPTLAGLGILPGRIRRFPEGMKVPHMGWNCLQIKSGSRLFGGIEAEPFVYFAHSYYLPLTASPAREATKTGPLRRPSTDSHLSRRSRRTTSPAFSSIPKNPETSACACCEILRKDADGEASRRICFRFGR